MKPAILRILSLVALLLIVASTGAMPVLGQEQAENATILLTADGYDPDEVRVEAGTQITWRNTSGDLLELVAVDNWFSPVSLNNNSQYSTRVAEAGTFRYYTREPGSTSVNPDQGVIQVTDDSNTPTPTPTGTQTIIATLTPTATVSATSTLVPTLTVFATVSVFPTQTPLPTATPVIILEPTETPPIIYFTATPYPTPGFPNTGGDDVLPPGRAMGVGVLLMLSALAVGIVYRRLRPDVGYRESDYEWRD